MKKIKNLLFLIFVLVFCLAGCGRDSRKTDEGGELVRAGENAPAFSLQKG